MTWLKLCAAFFVLLLTGCILVRFDADPGPYGIEKGNWTGRIVPLVVYDEKGTAYEAAALEISSGPSMPGKRGPKIPTTIPLLDQLDHGRLPLLVAGGSGALRMMWRDELPMGGQVRVSGMMNLGLVEILERNPLHSSLGCASRNRDSIYPAAEHFIMINRRPSVIDE